MRKDILKKNSYPCARISYAEITEYFQNFVDDSSIEIRDDHGLLCFYSEGYDRFYDEGEVIERLNWDLKIDITFLNPVGEEEVVYIVYEDV